MKFYQLPYILLFAILGTCCIAQDLKDKKLAISERNITPGNDSCVLFLIRDNKFYASAVKLGVEVGNHYFVILPNKSFAAYKLPTGKLELYAHFLRDLNYQFAYCDSELKNQEFIFHSRTFQDLPDYLTDKEGHVILKLLRLSVLDLGLDECKKAVQIFSDKKGMVECCGVIEYKNPYWNPNDTAMATFITSEPPYLLYHHPGLFPQYEKLTHLKKLQELNLESGKYYFINIEPKITELIIEEMEASQAKQIINKLPAASYKFRSKKPYYYRLFDFIDK